MGYLWGPPKSKYQSSVSGQLKEYFGESKEERAIAYALLEVTSQEAALTGNDVTWSHVTALFSYHSSSAKMTGSSMANGCDMNGSHVTGSDVIFPAFFSYYSISIKWPEVVWLPDLTWRHRKWRHKTESGWFPLGCFLIFSRCCVVLQGCFLSCLRSHCGISTK